MLELVSLSSAKNYQVTPTKQDRGIPQGSCCQFSDKQSPTFYMGVPWGAGGLGGETPRVYGIIF